VNSNTPLDGTIGVIIGKENGGYVFHAAGRSVCLPSKNLRKDEISFLDPKPGKPIIPEKTEETEPPTMPHVPPSSGPIVASESSSSSDEEPPKPVQDEDAKTVQDEESDSSSSDEEEAPAG